MGEGGWWFNWWGASGIHHFNGVESLSCTSRVILSACWHARTDNLQLELLRVVLSVTCKPDSTESWRIVPENNTIDLTRQSSRWLETGETSFVEKWSMVRSLYIQQQRQCGETLLLAYIKILDGNYCLVVNRNALNQYVTAIKYILCMDFKYYFEQTLFEFQPSNGRA